MAIIRDKYELDPYANALYLFCGRDKRKIKALHFDKDGFVLLQKRLDGSGRFQWPANAGTTVVPDRASSKGCTIRRVEIPSNKLLTTAFEASLECITVM